MARDEGNKKTINLIDSVNDFYAQTHICNETVTDDINLTDDNTDFNKDFQQWINDIYDGKPTPINQAVLKQTANHLAKGIMQGFSKPTYEHQDITMINKLLSNTWQFAGFKTLAQGVELNKLLLDENGKVRPFASFKKEAEKVGTIFNQNWLQTEYQHAIAASSAASKWVDIEKRSKALPLLQYDTAGDNRVRPEHVALDGITRPVDDSFWSTYYPPNGWNCRCTVRQLADGTITDKDKIQYPDEKAVPPMFRYNVGKDGVAFPKKTPFIANASKATAAIVNDAIKTDMKNSISKITIELKQKTYKLPITQQYENIAPSIQKHILVDMNEKDFEDRLMAAKYYVNKGIEVKILPEIYKSEVEARNKLMPNFKDNTNADLLLNNNTLVDVKKTDQFENITTRITKGYSQANSVFIIYDKSVNNLSFDKSAATLFRDHKDLKEITIVNSKGVLLFEKKRGIN